MPDNTLMGVLQGAIRQLTGKTDQDFNGDLHDLCSSYGIIEAPISGRLIPAARMFDSSITTASSALNYYLQNPQSVPSLGLNFLSGNLDPKITFTRASTATYTDSAGLIASAAINAPRFDYDPVTLQPKGLLIEEQRTNLLTYSEQFDNGIWLKSELNTTGTPPWVNVAVSPDGITTADSLIASGVNALHLLYQDIVSAITTYTFSVYAKSNGYRIVLFTNNGGSNNARGFDLSNGTTFANTSGYTEPLSHSITSVGNGWYRCSITFQKTSSISCSFGYWLNNGTSDTFAGNGTSGVYIWGAQLEAGAFATSYIPTVAAQVTRAADNAVMTGTNLTSWNNLTTGTILGVWTQFGSSSGQVALFDNTSTGQYVNNLGISNNNPSSGFLSIGIRSASVTTYADQRAILVANGLVNKAAFGYAANDFASTANGQSIVSQASGAMPIGIDIFRIGFHRDGTYLNGSLRSITYWPRRLSNAELQSITA